MLLTAVDSVLYVLYYVDLSLYGSNFITFIAEEKKGHNTSADVEIV